MYEWGTDQAPTGSTNRNFSVEIEYFDDSTITNDIANPDFNWIRYAPVINIDAIKFYLPMVTKWKIDDQFKGNNDVHGNQYINEMYKEATIDKNNITPAMTYADTYNAPQITQMGLTQNDKTVPKSVPPDVVQTLAFIDY
jgi:hypothetical protein